MTATASTAYIRGGSSGNDPTATAMATADELIRTMEAKALGTETLDELIRTTAETVPGTTERPR